jgi:hypothetical protein
MNDRAGRTSSLVRPSADRLEEARQSGPTCWRAELPFAANDPFTRIQTVFPEEARHVCCANFSGSTETSTNISQKSRTDNSHV